MLRRAQARCADLNRTRIVFDFPCGRRPSVYWISDEHITASDKQVAAVIAQIAPIVRQKTSMQAALMRADNVACRGVNMTEISATRADLRSLISSWAACVLNRCGRSSRAMFGIVWSASALTVPHLQGGAWSGGWADRGYIAAAIHGYDRLPQGARRRPRCRRQCQGRGEIASSTGGSRLRRLSAHCLVHRSRGRV